MHTDAAAIKKFKVWLGRAPQYNADALAVQAGEAFEAIGFRPSAGTRVLVKPNLLWADPLGIGYTHPLVVRAACLYLLDYGCRVSVADSPGFGKAARVAEVTGLTGALSTLPDGGLKISEMGPTVKKPLSLGGSIGIARRALEADVILNLPKLKAHRMMRFSGAVKNLFGCVSGVQKAVLHSRHGDKQKDGIRAFPSLIADLLAHLPPNMALIDGITAMHKSGPMKGAALDAGFIAAASSSTALDTALYTLMNQPPDLFPIWAELQRRKTPGAFEHELQWLGEKRENMSLEHFQLPLALASESFNPVNLCVSAVKRAVAYMKK